MNLTIVILDFGVRLPRMQKTNPIWIFLWQTKVSEAVCKRDWHNVRSYLFFNLRTFRTKFDAVQLSCPLSRKTPPKHNASTSMFDGGDGVLGVIGSNSSSTKHSELNWCQRAGFWSRLTTTLSPSSPLNRWHTANIIVANFVRFTVSLDFSHLYV